LYIGLFLFKLIFNLNNKQDDSNKEKAVSHNKIVYWMVGNNPDYENCRNSSQNK